MRTSHRTLATLVAAVSAIGAAGAARTAAADASVMGVYDAQFIEGSNTCSDVGMALGRGTVTIRKGTGTSIAVDIERIPIMTGSPSKGGKVKASSKLAATSIQGLDGRFSIAGRVTDDVLSLVFVAEYYAKNSALCTQSWNVSALRKAPEPPAKAAAKAAPKPTH